jgi:DoxX-like family
MKKVGWIMAALFVLFMLGASIAPKFAGAEAATQAVETIGWSPRYLILIGIMELVFVALFVFPRTSLVGAVLMTGLLGGAIASHLRADSPLFSHTLFGVYLGVLMWTSLWLRDPRLRAYFRTQA